MNTLLSLGALALAGTLLPAVAQPVPADAASARKPAPALRYDSAFTDYKPWQDTRPADWRQVNAAVRDAASAAPAAASAASATRHHGTHGGPR